MSWVKSDRRSVKKFKENLMGSIDKQVSDALEYTSEDSIYRPEDTVSELTTAQTAVLTLFYGLLFGDISLCQFIAQAQIPQLRSTYLRVWLADDFSFRNRDVAMVLAMLSFLLETQKVIIEDHILKIFSGLVQKYKLAHCCSKDLLAVFNQEQLLQVVNGENFQNANHDITNVKGITNGLSTAFRRMGSVRSWFQRNCQERTKEVEKDKFYLVTGDDYQDKETIGNSDLDVREQDGNEPHHSGIIEGSSVDYCERKDVSRSTKMKNHLDKITLDKHNVVDSDGRTVLHRLAQFGRTKTIGLLLMEGVNIEVTDYSGKTTLHWAVEYNHYSTADFLLNAGAEVNARTYERITPLCYAFTESGVASRMWNLIVAHNGTM